MSVKPIRLIDLFRYYQKLGHQTAAINELEQEILKVAPDILNRDQEWYSTWSSAVEPKTPFRNAWDGVYESAVIGAPHPDFGEAVVAYIVADGSQSVILHQVSYGVAVRMAILSMAMQPRSGGDKE